MTAVATEPSIMEQLNDRALQKGIDKRREELEKRRLEHANAAWAFITEGKTDGPSPDGEPWSRKYNPLPYPEALPEDLRMYEGTGVGALYGLPGSHPFLWELAGWNVARSPRAPTYDHDAVLALSADGKDGA